MDDDKLKELFSGFEPELSPDSQFMSRLQRRMEAVELVKTHSAALRRRNKIAVVVAAVSGFVTGVVMTLLYPLIGTYIMTLPVTLPHISIASIHLGMQIAVWTSIALVSGITAYNAYQIALSRLSMKEAI